MNVHVLTAGYVTLDVMCRISSLPHWDGRVTADTVQLSPGGMAANAAVAAATAGATARTFSQVAAGAVGDDVLRELQTHGVDVSHIDRPLDDTPATCVILVDGQGRRAIISEPYELDWTTFDRWVGSVGHTPEPTALHVDGYHLDGALARRSLVRERAWWSSVDLDGCTELDSERIAAVAAGFDVIVANEGLATVAGLEPMALGEQLAAHGATVAVTQGEQGALIVTGDGGVTRLAVPKVDVLDTTGAGDVFTGSFLVHLLAGDTPLEAGRYATAAATLATTARGARGFVPPPEVVARYEQTTAAPVEGT